MSVNPATEMDVDSPVGPLKRCSSAPTINENNSTMTTSPSINQTPREAPSFNLYGFHNQPRIRRFSASFTPISGSPNCGLRLTPRISQIRQEEYADISNLRELAHEREVHHNMQISQSWEDLRLVTDSNEQKGTKMGPLHVSLPCYGTNCNSPSPTRLSSPGFQSPTRGSRTFVRRSASPVLRPSPLGVKRKLDDDTCHLSPRAKRLNSFSSFERTGLLTTTSSPLFGSLSSTGTPESVSSADSPNFHFRLMDSPSPNPLPPPEPMILSKTDQNMTESPS
ncbi:protein FAM122B isoform X2 [Agrilus planipennis]|uniref:Protein FAM122B isoform X2 n=1 Tax=Agrilus planipennis TaxID=224129 RepID=A0A1W4WZR6_AGRPL|nr:protein FAM122B isoform X2 [Agrilus planipennis]